MMENQNFKIPDYDLIVHDVMGTVYDTGKTVGAVIKHVLEVPEIRKDVSDKLGTDDLEDVVKKGEEASKKGNKKSKEFKDYVKVYEMGAEKVYGKNGSTKPVVYDDASRALETLARAGVKQVVYTSGSPKVTKSSFEAANLGQYITKYYSAQNIGGKSDAESYKKVAKDQKVDVKRAVYINDLLNEAEAAAKAGYGAVFLLDRKGKYKDMNLEDKGIKVVKTYDEILEQLTVKDYAAGTTTQENYAKT